MESKIHLLKKPAAGAARIGILYRSPPLENVQKFRKGGGSVRKSCDVRLQIETFESLHLMVSTGFSSKSRK